MLIPIKIAIADDSDLFCNAITRDLKDYNIEVVFAAKNGAELLERLTATKPDLVLLDLEMPIMDGNKTFDALKEQFPKMKIIILSTHDELGLIQNYYRRGARGYLCKGAIAGQTEILAYAINEVLANNKFFVEYDISNKSLRYTKRECEIIPLVCQGKTSKEIANVVGLSEKSISNYKEKLYRKVNSRNVTEFILYCLNRGLNYLGKH